MNKWEVERVKSSVCISRVVGRYVQLTVRGYKATGLCPFHDDHHPSLQVDMRKQSFICYACGERGDVIEFVKKIDRCSFPEALEKLGGRPLNRKDRPAPALSAGAQRSRPVQPLKKNPPVSAPGEELQRQEEFHTFYKQLMPYVSGVPELSPAWLDFEVGMAPVYSPYALKGRIVFPIRDEEGVLRGFSGRAVDPEPPKGIPKYLNTSSKEGFYKNRILYGLHRAKEAILREECLYMTEGFKDAIAMHAAGFTHSVALMGKEMSEEQLRLVKKYTGRVFLVLDSDKRGQEGVRKIVPLLEREGVEVYPILLPEGEDPDSLFRKMGCEVFAEYIRSRSQPLRLPEAWLLYGCIRYPDAVVCLDKVSYSWVGVLPDMLETDRIPFESGFSRQILSTLSRGLSPAEFSGELKEWVEEFEKKWVLYPDEKGKDCIRELVYLYAEDRLVRQIATARRRLSHDPSPAERHRLFAWLYDRQQLLDGVSVQLKRPGAVSTSPG